MSKGELGLRTLETRRGSVSYRQVSTHFDAC